MAEELPTTDAFYDVPTGDEPPFYRYAPEARSPGSSYSHFLDKLGFKPTETCLHKRVKFVQDLQEFTKGPERMYLRQADNEVAFHATILAFLQEHGAVYWGDTERGHLQVLETWKGFLYPRDSRRESSRLIEVLGELFNYKAKIAHQNDSARPFERQLARRIDFKTLTKSSGTVFMDGKLKAEAPEKLNSSMYRQLYDQNEEPDGPMLRSRKRAAPWTDDNAHKDLNQIGSDEYLTGNPFATGLHSATTATPAKPPSERTSKASMSSTPNLGMLAKRRKRTSRKPPQKKPKLAMPSQLPNIAQATRSATRRSARTFPTPAHSTPEVHNHIVDLEDEEPVHEQSNLSADIQSFTTTNTAKAQPEHMNKQGASVKSECVSDDILAATFFTVTASNQPTMAPVTVAFKYCSSFDLFFPTMIAECGIRDIPDNKIMAISATYTWNQKKHRIRRNRAEDWTVFCTALGKTWDRNADQFQDGCEVALLIHVEE